MNAPAQPLQLPLDPAPWEASPQYLRLFGNSSPAQVMAPPVDSAWRPDTCAPRPASCDPSQAAGYLSASSSEAIGQHFSPALLDVARLRARHVEKGHTPEADTAHGWHYFKRLSDEAYRDGVTSRSPQARRERLIIAVAIIVAQIDAEDFLAQQQEPTA